MRETPRLSYVPALDGLRGLAVAAVLLFHAQAGLAPAGFLGVSVFFTLSGYLITSLLLAEHEASGTISLRAFYSRRLRRLLPAAYACIAAVLAMGVLWTPFQRLHLRGDTLAALANVSNWRSAFSSTSYRNLFLGSPSPLAHFWSLAIEEQCYIVVPVVAFFALRRGRRQLFIATLFLLACTVAATALTSNIDIVYNGTHTRGAELLVGVLLAQLSAEGRLRRLLSRLGGPALIGLGALIATTNISTHWLYRGGFIIVALLSAAAIANLVSNRWTSRIVQLRLFAALGKISYGLYLVHWPIFLALSPQRTHVDGLALGALRVTISLLVTLHFYWMLEQPIRQRVTLRGPLRGVTAGVIALGLLIGAAIVAIPPANFSASAKVLVSGSANIIDFAHNASNSAPTTTEARLPRLLVLGNDNSSAAQLDPERYESVDGMQTNCALARASIALFPDATAVASDQCELSSQLWPRLIAQYQPDVVVISTRSPVLDLGAVPPDAPISQYVDRWNSAYNELDLAFAQLDASPIPYVLVENPSIGDDNTEDFDRLRLTHPRAGLAVTTHSELVAAIDAQLNGDDAASDLLSVLVVGDSTSLFLARALSDAASDRLQVTWAGENGCPFVRVEAIRASRELNDTWSTSCTPVATKVQTLIATHPPDVVLLASTVYELEDQRYLGDPEWHTPKDAAYRSHHDTEMSAFVAMLQTHQVPLLVATSPGALAGPFFTPEMTAPWRLIEWNSQINRWCDSSPYIDCFDYAGPLLAAEAVNGVMRSDGVHPDIEPLTALAQQVLANSLIAKTLELRQTLGLAIQPAR